MQLMYRGTAYTVNPNHPKVSQATQPSTPYQLIYRGTTYTVDPSAKRKAMAANQAAYKFSYRGMSYQVTFTEAGQKQYTLV